MLQEQHKDLPNNDISRILGNLWKEMAPEAKRPYVERALRIKAEFTASYPDYTYTKSPRKRQKLKLADKLAQLDAAAAANKQQPSPVQVKAEPPTLPPAALSPELIQAVAGRLSEEMHLTVAPPECVIC